MSISWDLLVCALYHIILYIYNLIYKVGLWPRGFRSFKLAYVNMRSSGHYHSHYGHEGLEVSNLYI